MKERHRKGKKRTKPPVGSSTEVTLLARFYHYADSSHGRLVLPALVAISTLFLGIWTFDSKLSLSGDNTEFIILARSLAQAEGLVHINVPDPQPATK